MTRKKEGNKQGFKIPGVSAKLFINEHLPPHLESFLKEIRVKSKANNICKYIWVQNGNIFARKNQTYHKDRRS